MFYYIMPIPCMYFRQFRQGLQNFIVNLNNLRSVRHFSESGKSSHIFGPRNAGESFPCASDLTARLLKNIFLQVLKLLSFYENISFKTFDA